MGRYIGDMNALGMFFESGLYANPTGTTLQWIGQVQEHSMDENTNVISTRYLGGANRNVQTYADGELTYNGTITYFPQDFKLLAFALGSCQDTSGTAAGLQHFIREANTDTRNYATSGAQNPWVSFALEDSKKSSTANQNFIRRIVGCVADTFTLNASAGEIISCEVSYIGQSGAFTSGAPTTISTTGSHSSNAYPPYMWSNMRLHIPSGTPYLETKELKFSIANNMVGPQYIDGTRLIATPYPLNRDYEITATMDASSEKTKTLYESYFIAGSTFNAMIELMGKAGSAFIICSGVKMMDMEMPSPKEGINEMSLTMQPSSTAADIKDNIDKYNAW